MHDVACSEHRGPTDDGVCVKSAPLSEDDARLDDRVRADDDVVREFGSPVDDGRLVRADHGVIPRGR
jgi:hypothetical protein